MTEKYGALQAASQDAGSWQLIEQTADGEWAPLARGGKQNIVKLAGLLNHPPGNPEKWSLYRQLQNQPPSDYAPAPAITRSEVEQWDVDTYMTHRGRLWTDGAGGHRDGSENGRAYTAAAAELMTGRKENHPAWRQHRAKERDSATAAREIAQTWEHPNGKAAREEKNRLVDEWPQLASQLQTLATMLADPGPQQP